MNEKAKKAQNYPLLIAGLQEVISKRNARIEELEKLFDEATAQLENAKHDLAAREVQDPPVLP